MAGASVDPVGAGLVASLARPGGNITGVTLGDLAGKRVELLKDVKSNETVDSGNL
jgi:putative ABC transport system substrate-binding protein